MWGVHRCSPLKEGERIREHGKASGPSGVTGGEQKDSLGTCQDEVQKEAREGSLGRRLAEPAASAIASPREQRVLFLQR